MWDAVIHTCRKQKKGCFHAETPSCVVVRLLPVFVEQQHRGVQHGGCQDAANVSGCVRDNKIAYFVWSYLQKMQKLVRLWRVQDGSVRVPGGRKPGKEAAVNNAP